jgi:hypothetical protein
MLFVLLFDSSSMPIEKRDAPPRPRIQVVETVKMTPVYKHIPPVVEGFVEETITALPTDMNWSLKSRGSRSKIIYDTLCKIGGWWGDGCPTEKDLVAWLLFAEGSTLSLKDRTKMGRGIRYRFANFTTDNESFVYQLSFFTPFINPNGDSELTIDDWYSLTKPSIDLVEYENLVDEIYSSKVNLSDGNYIYWWSQSEVKTPMNKWPGDNGVTYFVIKSDIGKFYFTGIPNIVSCAMRGVNCR